MFLQGMTEDAEYKDAFLNFIESKQWDCFITIGIGLVDDEDDVLRRLRLIEAELCGKYLVNRYHKLPDNFRYCFAVAFEGEVKKGTRHAHILAHVPKSTKRSISRRMSLAMFQLEFRFLWNRVGRKIGAKQLLDFVQLYDRIRISPANTARVIYACKDIRQHDVAWSRFEFVTPPKFKRFNNENLKRQRDLNYQARRYVSFA